jgi:threonine dehydratase
MAPTVAAETGAASIPSYDDLDVIAGQGTVALEVLDHAACLTHSIAAARPVTLERPDTIAVGPGPRPRGAGRFRSRGSWPTT